MPFVRMKGVKGLVYTPEATPAAEKKHPCPDCTCCQWCSDARCSECLRAKRCRRGRDEKPKPSQT